MMILVLVLFIVREVLVFYLLKFFISNLERRKVIMKEVKFIYLKM